MNETFKFLKENTQVNYLDTVKGDKPSCRPFGDPIMYDGKIYVITSKHKEVSKQIAENNNVCIVAYDDENWIRINCQLIDDSNNVAVKQAVINEFDCLLYFIFLEEFFQFHPYMVLKLLELQRFHLLLSCSLRMRSAYVEEQLRCCLRCEPNTWNHLHPEHGSLSGVPEHHLS